MPGTLKTWPGWPEYEHPGSKDHTDPDFVQAKRDIIAEYGELALTEAWNKTCKALEQITADLALHGRDVVPVFEAEKILADGLSAEQTDSLRNFGCCIVRGVLGEEEAAQRYEELKHYIAENCDQVQGCRRRASRGRARRSAWWTR